MKSSRPIATLLILTFASHLASAQVQCSEIFSNNLRFVGLTERELSDQARVIVSIVGNSKEVAGFERDVAIQYAYERPSRTPYNLETEIAQDLAGYRIGKDTFFMEIPLHFSSAQKILNLYPTAQVSSQRNTNQSASPSKFGKKFARALKFIDPNEVFEAYINFETLKMPGVKSVVDIKAIRESAAQMMPNFPILDFLASLQYEFVHLKIRATVADLVEIQKLESVRSISPEPFKGFQQAPAGIYYAREQLAKQKRAEAKAYKEQAKKSGIAILPRTKVSGVYKINQVEHLLEKNVLSGKHKARVFIRGTKDEVLALREKTKELSKDDKAKEQNPEYDLVPVDHGEYMGVFNISLSAAKLIENDFPKMRVFVNKNKEVETASSKFRIDYDKIQAFILAQMAPNARVKVRLEVSGKDTYSPDLAEHIELQSKAASTVFGPNIPFKTIIVDLPYGGKSPAIVIDNISVAELLKAIESKDAYVGRVRILGWMD